MAKEKNVNQVEKDVNNEDVKTRIHGCPSGV